MILRDILTSYCSFFSYFQKILFHNHCNPQAIESLYSLACGPNIYSNKYSCCIVNEVRFHTYSRDSHLRSQNNGILVERNHKDEIVDVYNMIIDITELDYVKG